MLTICITGGSGSGKTTLANMLSARISSGKVSLLPMDAYYKDHSHLSKEELECQNFDHPDSVDFDLMTEHLQLLKLYVPVERPVYSYLSCSRQPQTVRIEPNEIIIIDGLLALCCEQLRNEIDLKIFLDVNEDNRLSRLIQRDVAERGRSHEAIEARYNQTVKPMYDAFVEPSMQFADIVLEGNDTNTEATTSVVMHLINSCLEQLHSLSQKAENKLSFQ